MAVAVLVAVFNTLDKPESDDFVLGVILTHEDTVGHRLVDGNMEYVPTGLADTLFELLPML